MWRLAVLILALLPLEAVALSCMEPSITRSFHQVNAAPETYVVVEGRLTVDMRKVPKTDAQDPNPPKLTLIKAHLTGKSMTLAGFVMPFDKDVTLELACFGPWCGGVQNGMEVLAFVRRSGDDYAIAIDPCGGSTFPNTRKLQRQVLKCFQGRHCPK